MRLIDYALPAGGSELSSYGGPGPFQLGNVASFSNNWHEPMTTPEKPSAQVTGSGASFSEGSLHLMRPAGVLGPGNSTMSGSAPASAGQMGQPTAQNMDAAVTLHSAPASMSGPQDMNIHKRLVDAQFSLLSTHNQAGAWTAPNVNAELATTTDSQQVGSDAFLGGAAACVPMTCSVCTKLKQ